MLNTSYDGVTPKDSISTRSELRPARCGLVFGGARSLITVSGGACADQETQASSLATWKCSTLRGRSSLLAVNIAIQTLYGAV